MNALEQVAVPTMTIVGWSRAAVFVRLVWIVMLAVPLFCITLYGRNIPLAEDWLLVPALTGQEPDLVGWVWAQNNEHRVPLPKIVMLLLLKATGGDFRAGMVFNTLALGGLVWLLMRAAERLRGGRVAYADAFFPIALLHLGNWDNLVWSWQLSFVVPTVMSCLLLLVIAEWHGILDARAAGLASICLLLLPVAGANGLIMVLPLACWFGVVGVLQWRAADQPGSIRRRGLWLIAAASGAVLLTGLYFVGYVRPWWYPPSPSHEATASTALKFLALAWGPAAISAWAIAAVGSAMVFLPTLTIWLEALMTRTGSERLRAVGLGLFLGGVLGCAVAVGYGRASQVPLIGMPPRYAILAVPALFASYFIWLLYGVIPLRRAIHASLLLAMVALLPLNTAKGFEWCDWYRQGMEAVEHDLAAGIPGCLMVERHRPFLLHWNHDMLASHIRMLRHAGTGPFQHLVDEPTNCLAQGQRKGS
jgi:hypothetical protein